MDDEHTNGGDLPRPRSIYRSSFMRSRTSLLSDVEMAQEEVYAGPISESIPSSVASFVRRRSRRESNVSFTYFQENNGSFVWPDDRDEEAVIEPDQLENGHENDQEVDIETPFRPSSYFGPTPSHDSAEDPLLWRRASSTDHPRGGKSSDGIISQKIYIASEDLTAAIAGFSTSMAGLTTYLAICILTCGLGYLVFRWVPKWRVSLIGTPTPLYKCQWVAIENQWGQFTIQDVQNQPYGRQLSTVFGRGNKEGTVANYEYDDDPIMSNLRYLDYHYVRFFYQPVQDRFSISGTWADPAWADVKLLRRGLDADERESREQVFGANIIDIQAKTIPQILLDEAFHPFYIFQIASLTLWSMDEYYYYATCIFFISVFSITATAIETRSTMRRLREIAHFECEIRVLRSGFWTTVPSTELIPGDVFEISDPSLTQIPCDCLLLSGDCIVNESMLTGESVPVSKFPVTDHSLAQLNLSATSVDPGVARHFLFCGTKLIRARRPQDPADDEAAALAMVVRTGFNTTKGALVRSMLFPKPSGFKFYQDSFRYISVMATVAAIGFVVSFVNFIRLKIVWHTIIVRALDLITIVVPPALPATLTIGINFAISRLKSQQIFCISPQRFSDLLTETSLILPQLLSDRDPTQDYGPNTAILYTMATCHSLRMIDGELIGDPLDVKMFEFTNWSYEEGSHNTAEVYEDYENISPSIARSPPNFAPPGGTGRTTEPNDAIELSILRIFEFVSQLRRASVVVRQPGSNGVDIFVKGAPECMKDICIPKSLPPDFSELLNYYTHRGFRVIACATKHIPQFSLRDIFSMSRADAESGLEFIGFIIFENKLKPTSKGVITELHEAGIRSVMCTGDNILTAVSVARECGFVEGAAPCFVPYFVEGKHSSSDPDARLCWQSIDNPDHQLDENTLTPLPHNSRPDVSVPYNHYNKTNYAIAVTGDVFRWVVDYGPEAVLNRMLVRGQVFARMSPDEKHELVEKLQSLNYGCGFCGDGANDCGALKAADVGISLSEAEASVAAPFTSRVFDISCVPKLIREGRAALVTSFCCFKYMSLYSAIQFTSVSFLYATASNLGDFQFLFIDLVIILPVAIFMGWIGPSPVLCRKRPTANLVSRKVLTPLLGQILICILIQATAYETVQIPEWYIPPKISHEDTNIKNSQNTALFLVSCYQYVFSGVVLSAGKPFRKPATSNVPFVATIIIILLFSSYMLFQPAKWLYKLMELTYMSPEFKSWILVLALGGFAAAWVCENHVFPQLARGIGRLNRWLRPHTKKQRRRYKVLLEGGQ
ncbi:cation translocating P-type ATPase [Nannizzia gypsea CBS 118893]|uniref:Cation-transporting ATPase n=1 Tax=Arthroderma gypseum (strain ATCC MYA-4604 / CBS 118893) TaxID=535722 RepID=E4UV13_ARTGP|nr:cation translocating P-type ATPase [Nannizzia gypsea CBS 118893]EFR01130.1 cation translocating P-type ATPase [Nannizzia gypsea CBS 118893]